ncbi:MAG: ubiquinol oxidase subunit II [Chlamydiales bacterium]|nr:ubiquinol oxidase subunit II [Chlamydiales bacterium]
MMKKLRVIALALLCFGAIAATFWFLSSNNIAVLDPKGMIAIKERKLLVIACLLMLIVVIPVFVFTIFFAWKYRQSNTRATYSPDWAHSHLAESLWWGVPLIIICILGVFTWKSSYDLHPFKPIDTGKKPVVIQVVALDWKWLFIYPDQGIATVNFVQFPEKTPIDFEITADAPMNSFWIPELGGQIYAMPAMKSTLYLIANENGLFRGCSSNISGKGFAGMTFNAKATSQADFDQWVQSVKQSPKLLTMEEYNQLMKPSEYHPVILYQLKQKDLFDRIIMKYNKY